MKEALRQYRSELEGELEKILSYWIKYTVDREEGGFHGKVLHDNTVVPGAPKGSVLHSRILWTFSAAFGRTGKEEYRDMAGRAFRYLSEKFMDREWGGVYWTVDSKGVPLDTKKQVYALAFAVYAFSEYARWCGSEDAKENAVSIFRSMEQYSHDSRYGGYVEALTRDWKEIEDLRLSSKDANEKKSMNTHLHVLEGYANLYRLWPDAGLKGRIRELIRLFLDQIIDRETNHLVLFFDEQWQPKSGTISYGHDIEAAWLVQEAAEVIGEEALIDEVKARSVKIAEAAEEGLDADGGLWYEKELTKNHLIKEKHWWPQAEAMVGFLHAGEVTGDPRFLQLSLNSWQFTKKHLLHPAGEWSWGVYEDYSLMAHEDKAGLWKCPYHNGRACLEVLRRIGDQ